MIIEKKEDIKKAIELLNTGLYCTFDIETNSLNPRKGKIIGFGCCIPDSMQAFYIIMKEWRNGELVNVLSDSDVLPVIKLLQKRRLIGWNLSFDCRFAFHYFNVNLYESIHHDGMLALHTLDENRLSYKLKDYAAEIFGDSAKNSQADMLASIKINGGTEKEYYKADSTIMATYGLQDNIMTAKIYNMQVKQLSQQGLSKFFYDEEVIPLLKHVTIPMELNGIPVNVPYMEQTLAEITVDMQTIHDRIQTAISPLLVEFNAWYVNKEYPVKLSGEFLYTLAEIIAPSDWPRTKSGSYSFSAAAFKKKQHLLDSDLWLIHEGKKRLSAEQINSVRNLLLQRSNTPHPFNILSKDHLKRLLFEKLKETPLSFTDKGNPQVSDDLLDVLADKYDWIRQLRIYNKLVKIKSTYVERFLYKQEDGIFYPSYFQHRTVSGRYGSDFQQMPRQREDGEDVEPIVRKYNDRIRTFFVSGEGYSFIDDDYESLEPHTFAHISNEEGLKNIFNNGHDFYSTIAIATEGLTEYSADKKAENYLGKKNKVIRQSAKAYSLGVPYGLGSYALSKTLNISDREAELLLKKYLNAYPNLKSWMVNSNEFAKKHGYIKVESGRLRRFPELPKLIEKYKNVDMTNSLEVWKAYNESPRQYAQAKIDAKTIKNCLNNAKNVQIQGLGASIVNRASIALAKRIKVLAPSAYICAQIHDQVVVRCKDSDVELLKPVVQDCLENTYRLSLKLKAVPSIGKNLAESKG